MRYKLMKNGMVAQQLSSMSQVDATWEATIQAMTPGDTIDVIDTKEARTIRHRHMNTAEENQEEANQELTRHFLRQLEKRAQVVEFTERIMKDLDTDPTYAFGWSDKYFEAAAAYRVALQATELRSGQAKWTAVLNQLTTELLHRSENAERSTATAGNYTERCILAAVSRAVRHIDQTLKSYNVMGDI